MANRRNINVAKMQAADTPRPIARPSREPAWTVSNDDLARLAYELYERRGGEHGHDWDDWFQAERELKS